VSHVPTDRAEALARAARGELLGPMDVAAIVGKGASRFYALNQRGVYDFLKVQPAVGPRCFSGTKVYRYILGETVEEPPPTPVFGRNMRRVS
jgi:hypothetical protein